MYDPIRLLVELDKDETKERLLSPSIMRYDHPLLAEALRTINELKSPPDPEFLNSLIDGDLQTPDWRKDHIRRAAIFGLIILNHPSTSGDIENILKDSKKFSQNMVLAAWTARFRIYGLQPIYDSALEKYEKAGYNMEPLSRDERDIILMHYLDSNVQNGGFWQWYSTDHGLFGEDTKNALAKVGAKKTRERLLIRLINFLATTGLQLRKRR